MFKLLKKLDYRHYIAVGITAGCLAVTAFIFRESFFRLITAFKDFGLSCAYWFCSMFGIKADIRPTVMQLQPAHEIALLPATLEEFLAKCKMYGDVVFTGESLKLYLMWFVDILNIVLTAIIALIPVVVVLVLLFKQYAKRENNDYGKQSRPLKLYLKIEKAIILPVKHWLLSCWRFIRENPAYYKLWLFIWLLNFNVIAIAVSFLAYYLYFAISFDFASLYTQIFKLAVDLAVPIVFVPLWLWGIGAVGFIMWWRKNIALNRLRGMEQSNQTFLRSMPIAMMIVGTMNKGKTKMMTDMSLSQSVIFREDAHEGIIKKDLSFWRFPWLTFELELQRAIEDHVIYSLATCQVYVRAAKAAFLANPKSSNCFGYDYKRYGLRYNDGLTVSNLFDVLETYAKLYFVYYVDSSLLISNYAIREDSIKIDKGNFPMWDNDFFSRDPELIAEQSYYATVYDFDMTRFNKTMVKDNPKSNALEFGALLITEVGKERGNQYDTQGMKRDDENANQKNDGTNTSFKTIRHRSTIDFKPYTRLFMDDQRPDSTGADLRELAELVYIEDGAERRLAMPFFTIGELLYDILFPWYKSVYYKYRLNRADDTLLMRAFKSICGRLIRRYDRIYNNYGYRREILATESGTRDGNKVKHYYYVSDKKAHSARYSTDCYGDFFVEKALTSKLGIADLDKYTSHKATFAEMDSQHSYLFNGLVYNPVADAAELNLSDESAEFILVTKGTKYMRHIRAKKELDDWLAQRKPEELTAYQVYMSQNPHSP